MRLAASIPTGLRHALDIVQRVIVALAGGYGVAALASVGLARMLPLDSSEAVMAAAMLGLLLHACIALWSFTAATTLRVWAGLILTALPFGLMAWLA